MLIRFYSNLGADNSGPNTKLYFIDIILVQRKIVEKPERKLGSIAFDWNRDQPRFLSTCF